MRLTKELWRGDDLIKKPFENRLLTEKFTREAISFVKNNKDKPPYSAQVCIIRFTAEDLRKVAQNTPAGVPDTVPGLGQTGKCSARSGWSREYPPGPAGCEP